MDLLIRSMTEGYAKAILDWKYEKPYDFYNIEPEEGQLQELLDGTYFAVVNSVDELCGFFCVGNAARIPAGHQASVYEANCVDVGFGMKPELTGLGNGSYFCMLILEFVERANPCLPLRLSVAHFNKRAIKLYKKLGFEMEKFFSTENGLFVTMIKPNTNG
ncbi:GNAT family N-acetyltransferase [Cytobacillus gottheilii]|uniref:GNAT family N-acetyltransferase n=1 Tax=Cytobacillus gottheilii TaxID=859144 RepID=UPI0009BB2FCF|nr:GNAT family N-acetyltransferase [Cytobacillus gottheilii]